MGMVPPMESELTTADRPAGMTRMIVDHPSAVLLAVQLVGVLLYPFMADLDRPRSSSKSSVVSYWRLPSGRFAVAGTYLDRGHPCRRRIGAFHHRCLH